MIERYRRWFQYEQDAHAKVLASLETVHEDRRGEDFQRAVDLCAHIMAARRLWLHRFGILDQGEPDLFPRGVDPASLPALMEQTHALWSEYLENATDDGIARTFDYTAVDGQRFRSVIEDILTQLFGHSLYHRGQIASLVARCGGEPAVTDFVYHTREPIQPVPRSDGAPG
ncbi:MAG: hypothetical protein IIC49_07925 [Planctomycetes bacterium]|nr:hypothetical protein [Planctomycetota bacterium]MCH7962250.1 hypothetical protein [Planctomycetota bacterium]